MVGTDSGEDRTGWLPTLHPSLLAAAIGVFASTVVFDYFAHTRSDQFIYAQGAVTLIGLGLLVGVVGVLVLVAEIATRAPVGAARRAGFIHLATMDLMLAWFAFCWLDRRTSSLVPTSLWVSAVSGMVVAAAAVSHLLDLRQEDRRGR